MSTFRAQPFTFTRPRISPFFVPDPNSNSADVDGGGGRRRWADRSPDRPAPLRVRCGGGFLLFRPEVEAEWHEGQKQLQSQRRASSGTHPRPQSAAAGGRPPQRAVSPSPPLSRQAPQHAAASPPPPLQRGPPPSDAAAANLPQPRARRDSSSSGRPADVEQRPDEGPRARRDSSSGRPAATEQRPEEGPRARRDSSSGRPSTAADQPPHSRRDSLSSGRPAAAAEVRREDGPRARHDSSSGRPEAASSVLPADERRQRVPEQEQLQQRVPEQHQGQERAASPPPPPSRPGAGYEVSAPIAAAQQMVRQGSSRALPAAAPLDEAPANMLQQPLLARQGSSRGTSAETVQQADGGSGSSREVPATAAIREEESRAISRQGSVRAAATAAIEEPHAISRQGSVRAAVPLLPQQDEEEERPGTAASALGRSGSTRRPASFSGGQAPAPVAAGDGPSSYTGPASTAIAVSHDPGAVAGHRGGSGTGSRRGSTSGQAERAPRRKEEEAEADVMDMLIPSDDEA